MNKIKSKFDIEMEEREQAFGDKKHLNIVLYGTGRMTSTLLNRQTDYRIMGLCDRDKSLVGTKVYGVKVVNSVC